MRFLLHMLTAKHQYRDWHHPHPNYPNSAPLPQLQSPGDPSPHLSHPLVALFLLLPLHIPSQRKAKVRQVLHAGLNTLQQQWQSQ